MLLTEARFIKPAETELFRAVDRYDAESLGLGQRFSDCIEATVLRAMHFPEGGTPVLHPKLRRSVRRFQADSPFPFDVVATVLRDELIVIAVAHHKRKPGYWFRRMPEVSR
jgi:toxin ParE1/3/4